MHRVATVFAGLAIAAGFYLLLIDTADPPELYAGCGVVLLAAVMFEVSREQRFAEAAVAPRWLARGWRVLVRLPTQIALVCAEAVAQVLHPKRSRGVLRAVSFENRGEGPALEAGRRALAEALGSLTPNTIVIGIDPERKLLLVHQLHRQGGREELDVLRLG